MLNVPEKGGRTTFDIILRPPFYKSINQGNIWQIMTNNPINNASIVHFITENEGIIINSVYELIQNGNEPIEQLKHFEVSETYNGWLDWSVSLIKQGCHLDGLEYNIAHHKFAIMGDKFCILTLK